MASKTLTVGNVFPDGTTVAAYPRSNWRQGLDISGAPVGSTAGSAGAISGGALTITGLADDTQYVLGGDIGGGTYRYLRFDTARSTAPATQTDLAAKAPLLSIVTSLPSSPVDGQECFYLADATNGVLWHLKYRAAEAGSYKWYVAAAQPLFAEVATSETTTSVTYADLATVGPTVTVPLDGDYDVSFGASATGGVPSIAPMMSYAIGAVAATDNDAAQWRTSDATSGGNIYAPGTRLRRKAGLAASTALKAKYRTAGAGTLTFLNRWIAARPIRVG